MRRLFVLTFSAVLASTAFARPHHEVRGEVAVPAPLLNTIRVDVVKQLVLLYPPALVRLYLGEADGGFGPALAADLRRQGYALVEAQGDATSSPGFNLRYQVGPVDGGVYRVTLHVGKQTLARAYVVTAGDAAPAGAWSIDLTDAAADLRDRVDLLARDPSALEAPVAPPMAAVNDTGSPAWKARLRAGPGANEGAPPATPTAVPIAPDSAVPVASVAATADPPPPLPPRLSSAAQVTPPIATPQPARSSPGPWRVQLGAYETQGVAMHYARELLRAHGSTLAGASPYYVRVGSKLPHTALQVGPYATRADAVSVCLGLRASRADCLVVSGG